MYAMVLTAPGRPLQREERELPRPGSGQVLLRVAACAV
jgi:propanol-preferring alcohol dehydrogenase